ncbi:subtilisin-like protease SBT4.10 [Macadamia integrifolia]|uniref:subtilisin-like protease SBT4.10 n=1 Tax=Macadamia integrifolia TaxID=60698 RepID=UPI001C4F6D3D|nr:subtilisin-like protease SBT4.10 [Macadamia integrifolia]
MATMRSYSFLITFLFLFSSFLNDFYAATAAEKKVYMVYMGELSKAEDEFNTESVHLGILDQVLDSSSARESLVYSYRKSFNGFAAKLTEKEHKKLRGMEGVVSVFPSKTLQLDTTRSWDFLGLPTTVKRMPTVESDVIIGMIDTGIWPESESFSDNGIRPPPSKWKGICQNFTCNNKIVGARFYNARQIYNEEEEQSPRDFEGHGSHTASTVAGCEVKNTSLYGLAEGTVRGAVPSARIAVYKVCWSFGCADHDILAAFDDAIEDGVDVLSVSLGSPFITSFAEDVVSIGSFHAMKKGILTSASAGNRGPASATITNFAPWVLTVAASTTDRRIISNVTTGNKITMMGHAVNTFPTQEKYHPIISAVKAARNHSTGSARNCLPNSLDKDLVKGKIVYCDTYSSGGGPFVANALGMVVLDDAGYDDTAFSYPLPAAALTIAEGREFEQYMKSTRKPVAKIYKSQAIHDPKAPYVASFSSRGGGSSRFSPNILKPDLSAPGVDILAAWSPKGGVSNYEDDKRSVMYNIISGTSMSCPHATGAAAYVKTFHPSWSPAAIKSALMTTASPMNSSYNEEAELAYGAGHIYPLKAINPGLVYDLQKSEYIQYLCSMGYDPKEIKIITGEDITCAKVKQFESGLNYPSFGAGVDSGASFAHYFPRTVTNVGIPNSTYKATVGKQPLLNITVDPDVLSFKSLNEKQQFTVNVSGEAIDQDVLVVSTWLLWSDGIHNVRSPIVFWVK